MSGQLRLRHRVLDSIRRHALWSPGQSVVVAVSGGRDSMVLLDVLSATEAAHGGRLSVLTVDHQQRAGSATDAAFVEAQAQARGLPVRSVCVEPASPSEGSLRSARHEVFQACVASGSVVALGHHRRDQAETVLLQLLRGGGARARRGMLPRHEGRVRPLLGEAPDALAAWAEARGVAWREDPSNASSEPLRNRVRQQLLPLLETLRPGAEATLARGARLAALDEACLDDLARKVSLTCSDLATVHPAIARRRLLRAWPRLGAGQVDALWAMAREGRGRVQLGGGRVVTVVDGVLKERTVGGGSGVVTTSSSAPDGPEDLQ